MDEANVYTPEYFHILFFFAPSFEPTRESNVNEGDDSQMYCNVDTYHRMHRSHNDTR